MIEILQYVKQHSTLILVVLALILFAIIGYYADKTNFGQGKNAGTDKKDINQFSEKILKQQNTRILI